MFSDLSKSESEALKAIYRHTKKGADAHTGDLAETLGVTPGTVTATIKRLAERDLVVHRRYHGVRFTDEGRRHAVAAIRRHRIVERFLADQLGYSWHEADRLAPTFEHELLDEVEERMFEVLGRPDTCPHGFPIPSPQQDSIPEMPTLYDLEAGASAIIALPSSTDTDIVRFLAELGVRPGVQIEVIEKHPFDGPLVLRVGDQNQTLGERIARRIYVRTMSNNELANNELTKTELTKTDPAPSGAGTNGGAAGTDDSDSAATRGSEGKNSRVRAAKQNGGTRAAGKQKEGTTR